MLKISKRLIVLFFSLFFLCGLTTFGCLADEDEVVLATDFTKVTPAVTLTLSDYCNEVDYKTIIADVKFSVDSTETGVTHIPLHFFSIGLTFDPEVIDFVEFDPVYDSCSSTCRKNDNGIILTPGVTNVVCPVDADVHVGRLFFKMKAKANANDTVQLTVSNDETATSFVNSDVSFCLLKKPVTSTFKFTETNAVLNITCVCDEIVEEKPATCTEPGQKAHFECKYCGKCYDTKEVLGETVVDLDKELSATDLVLLANGHTIDPEDDHVPKKDHTCTEAGTKENWKCSVCGQTFLDSEGTELATADTLSIPAGHVLKEVDETNSTCTTKGNIKHYCCLVCNKCYSDADCTTELTAVEKDLAGHDLQLVEAKSATCEQAGNEAHYKCSSCGKLFSDSEGTTGTTLDAVTIPAGHNLKYDIIENDNACHNVTCERDGCEFEETEEHSFTIYDKTNETFKCEYCGYVIKPSENTKTIILTRTTQDLVYTADDLTDEGFTKSTTVDETAINSENPEIYTLTEYDNDTYTLNLKFRTNAFVHPADFRVLVNGQKQEFTKATNGVYSFELPLDAVTNYINIEAKYDATSDGIFIPAVEGKAIMYTTYRNQKQTA